VTEQEERIVDYKSEPDGFTVNAAIIADDTQMHIKIICDGFGFGILAPGPLFVASTESGQCIYLTTHSMGNALKSTENFFVKAKEIMTQTVIKEGDVAKRIIDEFENE